jgi:hypothetical protein
VIIFLRQLFATTKEMRPVKNHLKKLKYNELFVKLFKVDLILKKVKVLSIIIFDRL